MSRVIKNLCCVAVFEGRTALRATAVVSDFTTGTIVDRLEFPNLDPSDEESLREAALRLFEFVEDHSAAPLAVPVIGQHQLCPDCKKAMDIGFNSFPENESCCAMISYLCWHCAQWGEPVQSEACSPRTRKVASILMTTACTAI